MVEWGGGGGLGGLGVLWRRWGLPVGGELVEEDLVFEGRAGLRAEPRLLGEEQLQTNGDSALTSHGPVGGHAKTWEWS